MKVIKEVKPPHNCVPELTEADALELYAGSIIECSCGQRYQLVEDQRDGRWWKLINHRPKGKQCRCIDGYGDCDGDG